MNNKPLHSNDAPDSQVPEEKVPERSLNEREKRREPAQRARDFGRGGFYIEED